MRASIVLPFVLILALLPAYAHSQGPVAVFISAVDAAGIGDSVAVNVTVAGGPAEEGGTYEIRAFLRDGDLEGASPLEDSPFEESSTNKTFSFNITMPLVEQVVELVVEVNSTLDAAWSMGSSTKRITVLVPLTVSASVENTGSVEVRDVPVFLYLDGERVAETVLGSLKPGESQSVSFEYLPVGLSVGTHRLAIAVDFDGDGVIDSALGEVVREITFTKEAEPINPLWIVLGAVVAFVVALFVGAAIRQRRRSRR